MSQAYTYSHSLHSQSFHLHSLHLLSVDYFFTPLFSLFLCSLHLSSPIVFHLLSLRTFSLFAPSLSLHLLSPHSFSLFAMSRITASRRAFPSRSPSSLPSIPPTSDIWMDLAREESKNLGFSRSRKPLPSSDIWMDLAQELSSTPAKVSPASAFSAYEADAAARRAREVANSTFLAVSRARINAIHCKFRRVHAEIHLPRARPSPAGALVKHRSTFDNNESAVKAETQRSTRKSLIHQKAPKNALTPS